MVSTARAVGTFLLFIGIGLVFFLAVWYVVNAAFGSAL
jgi:hypothetical protein